MLREERRKELQEMRSRHKGEKAAGWFSDELIEVLLDAEPKTIDELCRIKGFPRDGKRVAIFGEDIINVFRAKKVSARKSEVFS